MNRYIWPLTFAFVSLCLGTLAYAWQDVRYVIVTAITILIWCAVLVACIALATLTGWWTYYRITHVKQEIELGEELLQFARETSPSAPLPAHATLAHKHRWRVGWLQFTFISYSIGSMSRTKMQPYIAKNGLRYWTYMKNELIRRGWAWTDDKGTTRFLGHWQAFHRLIVTRKMELPYPTEMDPPVLKWIQDGDTNDTNMALNTALHTE